MLESLPEDTDPHVVQQLRRDPRVWIRNSLQHPIANREYDFKTEDGETKLNYLLHDDSWLNPDSWGDINVLKLCRGGLKSTTMRMLPCWGHDAYPALNSYYIAPSKGQVTDFMQNFRLMVEQSGLDSRYDTDNKTSQIFKTYRDNGNGDSQPVLGKFQTDSGWSEESVRGKHSQFGITDETQDLSKDVFNVFLPAIDKELPDVDWFPTVFCIGTPKETGSFYHELWGRSDQRTWNAEKRTWEKQSTVDPYTITDAEADELGLDVDDIEEHTVHGWHLDWINSPMHTDGEVARAKSQMTEMRFQNEVMAEFYDPEDNLLTESDIDACCSQHIDVTNRRRAEESTVVLGVDWGGGQDRNAADTVMVVIERMEDDDGYQDFVRNFRFLADDLSKRAQIREVEDWILQYEVDGCVVDYGFGSQALESLHEGNDTRDPSGYLETVVGAKYGGIKDKQSIKYEQNSGDERFFTCSKTRTISRTVDWFRDENITIPKDGLNNDDGYGGESTYAKLYSQLTAPYKELDTTPSGSKKVRISKRPSDKDDAIDAFAYAWLGLNEHLNRDSGISFVGTRSSQRGG
jgi:hypothetical protein